MKKYLNCVCIPQVALPAKSSVTHEVRLSTEERRIYDRLYRESRLVIYGVTYSSVHRQPDVSTIKTAAVAVSGFALL